MVGVIQFTVYCHTHVESGRRYIGLTRYSMAHRWHQHCAQAAKSSGLRSHWYAALRVYGKEAFSHEVLEVCASLEAASASEQKWIAHFDSTNPERGYNHTKGGTGYSPMTGIQTAESLEAARLRMAERWQDEQYKARIARETGDRTRAQWQDPAYREKMLAHIRSPESLARRSERMRANNPGINAGKTHCKRGHEFTAENTRTSANENRHCKTCTSDRDRVAPEDRKPRLKTHCKWGHPLSGDNVRHYSERQRTCVACNSAANKRKYRKQHPKKPPRTHCLRGHEFTPENTRVHRTTGGRQCKACQREKRRSAADILVAERP